MNELTHDSIRDAVADASSAAEVQEHLRHCPACQTFADSVHRLDAAVAAMDPPPAPDDLADRVLAALAAGPVPIDLAHRRSVRRTLRRSIVAISAAAALLVGVLLVRDAPEESGRSVLISAAEHIEADGTAAVRVEGAVDVTVRRDGTDPDFSDLPPELAGYFEARWNDMMVEFERSMATFEQQVDDVLDEMDDILDDFGASGAPAAPPTPPAPPAPPLGPTDGPAPTSPPDDLSLRLDIRAAGVVDVGGRLQLDGTVRPVAGTLPAPDVEIPFAVSVDELGEVVELPDGTGASLPSTDQGLATVLARPDALSRLLRAAEGEVVTGGHTEVDGEEVVRYRFRAEGRETEALIGSDGRLRALSLHDRGTEGRSEWRTRIDVTVSGSGVLPPERGAAGAAPGVTVPVPSGAAGMLYPLGPAVSEALRSRA